MSINHMRARLLTFVLCWCVATASAIASDLMHGLDFGMHPDTARAAMERSGWKLATTEYDSLNASTSYVFIPAQTTGHVRRSLAFGGKGLYSVSEFVQYPKSRRGHRDATRRFSELSREMRSKYGKSRPAPGMRAAYERYEGWHPSDDLRVSIGLDDYRADTWFGAPHYSLAYTVMDLRWYPENR